MKAGYAKIDITPPLGCVLNGYYRERYADRVIEPLYATSAAFSDGENTVVVISLDISEILQKDTDDIRARVAARTGLPTEAVFVACIHTHTAPVISEIPSFFRRDEAYYAQFCEKICDSAAQALADMREARAFSACAEAKGISFVRRFRMKDGTTATNPSWERCGEIAAPIGTPDETVQLVKLRREGAPDIAIVNFGTHPDVLGGTGICPDWPCYLRDTLEAALAGENDGMGVRVIFFNGAQGDVAHVDRMGGVQRRGVEHSRHMGRVIAGAVLSVYTYAEPIENGRVFYRQRMAQAALNKGTAEQVEAAHAFNARYLAGEDIPGFHFNDIVLARRYIRLEHCPPVVDLNIVCVGFGDVAFVGLPGEPFTDIGRRIKAGSPFAMTLPCCNANGSEGYFPTDDALTEGGYESTSALFLPGVADTLVAVSLETLTGIRADAQ